MLENMPKFLEKIGNRWPGISRRDLFRQGGLVSAAGALSLSMETSSAAPASAGSNGSIYKAIGVPYVTILFAEADVRAYLRRCGRPDWAPWVNDYSIERFRQVFRSHADTMDTLHYGETWNRWHARLIAAYPDVFRARAPSFESLLVDSVLARFRRRHRPQLPH